MIEVVREALFETLFVTVGVEVYSKYGGTSFRESVKELPPKIIVRVPFNIFYEEINNEKSFEQRLFSFLGQYVVELREHFIAQIKSDISIKFVIKDVSTIDPKISGKHLNYE